MHIAPQGAAAAAPGPAGSTAARDGEAAAPPAAQPSAAEAAAAGSVAQLAALFELVGRATKPDGLAQVLSPHGRAAPAAAVDVEQLRNQVSSLHERVNAMNIALAEHSATITTLRAGRT